MKFLLEIRWKKCSWLLLDFKPGDQNQNRDDSDSPCSGSRAETSTRWSCVQGDFLQSACTWWREGCSPHLEGPVRDGETGPSRTRQSWTGLSRTHPGAPEPGCRPGRWAAAREVLWGMSSGSPQQRGCPGRGQSSLAYLKKNK